MVSAADRARERAYLRELPRCECGRAATVELRNGLNESIGVFCSGCGRRRLRDFMKGRQVW